MTFALRANIVPTAQFTAAPHTADAFAALRQRAPRMTQPDFAARRNAWLAAPREPLARLAALTRALGKRA